MNKLTMHTPNLADENFKKLAALFPNAVTETIDEATGEVVRAIDKDVLMQEINAHVVDGREERYQFTWPDKKKAVLAANAPISAALRPVKADSVGRDGTPGGWDSENLYIEGDNLDVLKLLRETYLGKIKMIYIDPPYNTGNDFVYEDDFSEDIDSYMSRSNQYDDQGNQLVQNSDSNGRFHTDWLNMIYPRLRVAKDLLSEDGVILINMDENEITNLQKACLEIFGSSNDLGTIVWVKRNPKGDAQGVSYQHEYILVYAKNKSIFTSCCKMQRPKKNAAAILKKASQLYSKLSPSYTLSDINADFSSWIRAQPDFTGGEKAYNKIDENGEPYQAVSMGWPNKKKASDDYFFPLIHPVTHKECPVPPRGWRFPSTTLKKMVESGKIIFGNDEATQPRSKYLLKENMYENIPSMLYYGGSDTDMLSQLGIPFDTPKVVSICVEHIRAFTNRDDIILDFFSGSATTAHAVMQLNAEDGGQRKFIMVQLPEACDEKSEAYKAGYKNICEIGKERIRRAAKKIREDAGLALPKDFDGGFRCLRLDSSNMQDVYYNPVNLSQPLLDLTTDNIKPDRTPEDLLFQVMLELGVLPSSKIVETEIDGKKVFDVADGFLLACFDKGVTTETVTAIAKRQPYYAVFRDASMADDSTATNFDQIFETYSPSTVRKVL